MHSLHPSDSYVEAPRPNVTVLGNRALQGGALIQQKPRLYQKKRRRHQACVCTEERPCEDKEKVTAHEPSGEASGDTSPSDTLVLGFSPQNCERKKVCC